MSDKATDAKLLEVLARHWGFASLRPLQREAMEAALRGHDTLVVMPRRWKVARYDDIRLIVAHVVANAVANGGDRSPPLA